MPFFKKKRTPDKPQPVVANGIQQQQKVLLPVPPLQNFVPPPDVVADALAKSNRRSASTVSEVVLWARDHFCAFLKSEGFFELFRLWEEIVNFLEQQKDTGDQKDTEFEEVVFSMKSRIESSPVKLDIEKLNDSNNVQDCLFWITQTRTKLYETLQEVCLPRYQESKFHVKCQIDLFTNGQNVSLYDILLNQNAMFYFMEYAEQECKQEVLEFWLGATNFSDQFYNSLNGTDSTIDFKTAESDAMVLYEKYISLQATHPLGLRDEIRSEVERLICSRDEISHCFGSAIIEAFAFLHVSCLEGFLKSSLFLSFLSDLIGSMCSSKSQQTLDSNSVGSSSSVKSYPVSGSSSLTSPTPRHRSKLSLGRVNALGKFETDIDLEPLKHENQSIAKTVKKLLNFDEKEKAKEELAWQVAAMIVNEVTSVTMGPVEPKMILH